MWLPGLFLVILLTCMITKQQYGMPVLETLLALFLAFFFSFLAIQATGATGMMSSVQAFLRIVRPFMTNKNTADITPLTAASKASQVILGATTRGPTWTIQQAQRLNLLGGALSSIGASQAAGKVYPLFPPPRPPPPSTTSLKCPAA
jgi:hypothetical protein